MKLALALAALLLVASCGSDGGRATDPAGSPSPDPAAMPSAIPGAAGEVRSRAVATVMDTGRPELCLGPVAESYPPQCRGIPLQGWDWSDHHRMFETSGDIRWGGFAVTGTFDGTAMTVTGAIPSAVYDPGPPPALFPPRCEDRANADCTGPSAARLAQIQREVQRLPGFLTAYAGRFRVDVEVVHDDGSLQALVDATYGPGVVAVGSALVPVG